MECFLNHFLFINAPKLKKEIFYIIIQFLLFALYFIDVQAYEYLLPVWINVLLWILIVCGFLIIFFGIINLNEDISVFSKHKKDRILIRKGIYRYVRHPIYAGILLAMLSYAIITVSVFKLLIFGITAYVFYLKSIREEKWLINKFVRFRNYKDRTGRFFPKL